MTTPTTRIRPTFGYYRQSNGWITVSPATELEELSYRKENWVPLTRYGRVEMTTEYMAEHPFEPLFMGGGAKEMPVEQVIEMGFAMNPPLVPVCKTRIDQFHKHHTRECWEDAAPVIFPQLVGTLVIGPFNCTVCNKALPTEKARDQHEGVAHRPEKSDIRTGQTLAESLAAALRPQSSEIVSSVEGSVSYDILVELKALRAKVAALETAQPKQRRRRRVVATP